MYILNWFRLFCYWIKNNSYKFDKICTFDRFTTIDVRLLIKCFIFFLNRFYLNRFGNPLRQSDFFASFSFGPKRKRNLHCERAHKLLLALRFISYFKSSLFCASLCIKYFSPWNVKWREKPGHVGQIESLPGRRGRSAK